MPSTSEAKFILSAKDQTKTVFRTFNRNLKGMGKAITGVHTQLLSLAGIGGFGALVAGVISTNQEFQTLKASLKTVTGSAEAAKLAFDDIEEFARTTPFDIQQVTQAFIKLKSLGLDPSANAMRSYGNTASAMGKSLDQMIEAVADASTGEFERLKEFGIRASKEGDQIAFTFQGVTTTIGNSAAEITRYLRGIGNTNFAGAMDEQMNTLGGAFTNLSGAVESVQTQIGEAGLNDFVRDLTVDMTEFLNSLDEDQIRSFTHTAMNSFAGFLEAVQDAYNYVRGNEFLHASGVVGYLMFGRWGIGMALAIDKVNSMAASDLAQNWDYIFQSQITGGTTNNADLGDYQLGDFNRSGGDKDYLELLREMEEKYGRETIDKLGESNTLLQEIADRLREQTAATAG